MASSSSNSLKRPGDADILGDGGNNSTPQPNKIARTDSNDGGSGCGSGRNSVARGGSVSGTGGPPGAPPGGAPLGGNGDFSSNSKKKLAGATRTGQACDRCKIRKIRCDARPGGCSPCLQNHTECKTTDRITGRATSRGHTEQLENENAQLKMYMVELQQQLREHGVDPKPIPSAQHNYMPSATYWQQTQSLAVAQASQQQHNHVSASPQPPAGQQTPNQASLLPDFRAGCIGDNYLGVSSENDWLSPIEGTSLALFGTKIDLAEFMPNDSDPAASSVSYRTFLNHAFGRTPVFRPELPVYEQCKVYAEWYFRSIQQFHPLLHKPDFMRLLDRIHHENYQPTSAETVMVHMVLAIINFQFSARNTNDQARQDSMVHYHYACSLVPELISGHSLEDIQALTLICTLLRSQPRPGAAWMFTNMVLGLAIESGLHRSAKAWQQPGFDQDPHHLEMRKRTFWCILLFHVHLSGKLGRPMPMRLEDFDIEMPQAIPDAMPDESPDNWKNCSFRAGIECFKLLRIAMQVYSTIYTIRSTGQYETNMRQLESELEAFHAQIPVEFRGGPQTKEEDRVSAYYLDSSVAEVQLLLHHPSLSRSASPQVMASNLDICLHWSSRLLHAAVALKNLKSLDTTWFYATVYLAAIFTTLFAHTERRDQMTSADLQRLRQDMDQWVEVMAEVGVLLGATTQLQLAVRNIIEHSLGNIQKHLAARTASAAVASTISVTAQDQAYTNENGYNYNNGQTDDAMQQSTAAFVDASQPHSDHSPHAYQSATYGYAAANNGMYASQPTSLTFDTTTTYAGHGHDAKPNVEEQLVHAASLAQQQIQQQQAAALATAAAAAAQQQQQSPTATSFLQQYHSPTDAPFHHHESPSNVAVAAAAVFPHASPAAWRHFAESMMSNAVPMSNSGDGGDSNGNGAPAPGYLTSANALLGSLDATGAANGKPDSDEVGLDMVDAAAMSSHRHSQQQQPPWPLIHYSSAPGDGGDTNGGSAGGEEVE